MKTPLTKLQKEIMRDFYLIPPTRVLYTKKERQNIWNDTVHRKPIDLISLNKICPALAHQIKKSYEFGSNIQSAVFSECVYAQTFANMFNLSLFNNCLENHSCLSDSIIQLLDSYNLIPRYAYFNKDKNKILIQAGSCYSIDSALITVTDLNIYTIEFKEPSAKSGEFDLPKYKEDGSLILTKEFLKNNPQFKAMIEEQIQRKLNFFSIIGHNINNFSSESINMAVSNKYSKKYADVICTEDINGILSMIPSNQVSLWADMSGEIRPAGRNAYSVWTPMALKKFLTDKQAKFNGDSVIINKDKLETRKARGSDGRISGYKINPLFFIRLKDCKENKKQNTISFDIHKVKQLNPTIAGKLFFKSLLHSKVLEYYKDMLF